MKFVLGIFLIVGLTGILNGESLTGEIRVSHPENIGFLMEKFKAGFESKYPDVRIVLQSGANVRQVSDVISGNRSIDIIVVSDDRIARPQLEKFYSEKPVEFMSDEIALIAGKNAKHFDELQPRTWHTFLLRPEVTVLIPDPLNSYAGFRAPFVWKLAENWMRDMLLYENLTKKIGTDRISASPIPALVASEADYAFDYATQAQQNGLRLFRFMKYFNLGDQSLAHIYKSAAIEIEDKIYYGEPIIYSIGELKGSGNHSGAKAFAQFVASSEGRSILEGAGLKPARLN